MFATNGLLFSCSVKIYICIIGEIWHVSLFSSKVDKEAFAPDFLHILLRSAAKDFLLFRYLLESHYLKIKIIWPRY